MKNLKQILMEEINYWKQVKETSKNRLLVRTANMNISKRVLQIGRIQRKLKLVNIQQNCKDFPTT
jgi:hypothetical protein